MSTATETAILGRIIEPAKPAMSPTVARMVLEWEFAEEDRKRMHELLEKSKSGEMSRAERAEAEVYERVGTILSMLQLKAKRSLRVKRNGSA